MAITPAGLGPGSLLAALRAQDQPSSPSAVQTSAKFTPPAVPSLVAQRAPTMLEPLSIMDLLETAPKGWPLNRAPDYFGVPSRPMSPAEIERGILQWYKPSPSPQLFNGMCHHSGQVAKDGIEPGRTGDGPVWSQCNGPEGRSSR